MKLLTKEEEAAHYRQTVQGGILGGLAGLGAGVLGVYAGSARFPIVRHLTLPMKAFLATSGGTFAAIIAADRSSRAFEAARIPQQGYKDEAQRTSEQLAAARPFKQKAYDAFKEHKYSIVAGSWVASMAIALSLVGRNPYLTTSQKIVQARVYAQGLTVLVMAATAAFEIGDKNKGEGRWETVKIIDPNDPEHKKIIEKKIHHEEYAGEDLWRDMVEAEERRLKERQQHAQEVESQHKGGKESPEKDGAKKGGNGKKESDEHAEKEKVEPKSSGKKGKGQKEASKGGKTTDEAAEKESAKDSASAGERRPKTLP